MERGREASPSGLGASHDREGWRPFCGVAAGAVAGTARILVGHPFDTMKVLVQTGRAGEATSVLRRPTPAALLGLYRGVGPSLMTVCITTSMSFGSFEAARLQMLRLFPDSPLGSIFAAGIVSGAAMALPTRPLANVRVLQQTRGGADAAARSTLFWLRELWLQSGIRGAFRGLAPHVAQNSLGRGFYMTTYELCKETEERMSPGASQSMPGKVLAGASAGISGWAFTYPVDVVRSNMIADFRRERYKTALGCLAALYREGGLPRLYAGLGYTLVRAAPVAAVTLPTYDLTLRALLQLL